MNGMIVVGTVIIYAITMLVPVRLIMKRIQQTYDRGKMGYNSLMAVIFTLLLLSSWATEVIGIHALFGAFMAGLVMPKTEDMIVKIVERIESLSLALLLPLFFALTGLRTRIDLLSGKSMWGFTAAIIATAVLGKLAGAAFTAKATGMNWKDSLGLGVLMNTRGLVELVILNAGLDLGILSPALFTMLVLMALVTTFMTTPILIAMKIH
jgi:Kef-type K+ transport system membrane component KefB